MIKSLRLLIVEDSEDDALLMVRQINKGDFSAHHQRVETAEELRSALNMKEWDIIISDYSLPQFSGLAALKIFKEYDFDIPFILVSGTIGEGAAVKAMKAGANDYIMKDQLSLLTPSVERELREAENRRVQWRMVNEIQERTDDMALINELNNMANIGKTLKSIITTLAGKGKRIFSSFGLTVYLLDQMKDNLIVQNIMLSPGSRKTIELVVGRNIPSQIQIPLNTQSLYRKILDSRETVLIKDINDIERLIGEWTTSIKVKKLIPKITKILGIETVIYIPLIADDEILGLFELSRDREFTEIEIQRLKVFGEQITALVKRKEAEDELKISEDKYRTLANNLNVGVYRNTTGPKGRFIEVNPAIIEMFGYNDKKEFLQLHVSDLYYSSDERKIFNAKILKEGFVQDEEIRLKKKDSTVFIGSVSAVLVKDEKGKVMYYDGIIEDITRRKQAEQTLRETEERYRTLFERVPDGIYRSTNDGKFVDINPSMVRIFGYDSVEELMAIDIKSQLYVDPDDRDKATEEEKETGRAVVRQRKKDGSVIWIEDRGNFIYNEEGNILYHEGILRDITERKEAEEKVKASLEEKEILLKEIHHRVKNNMQVISSLLNLQSHRLKNKKALQMFNESRDRVRSMALVHEKLYQSKDFARIDFAEYIRSLTNYLYRSYEIDPGRIALKLNIGHVSPGIDLAVPCGLILNELVSNALKYAFPDTWNGKGKVTVSLNKIENGQLELIVSDNGIGLPETLDLIKNESLGLHLVSILAKDQLRGSIEIDSDKGATFCIRFNDSV